MSRTPFAMATALLLLTAGCLGGPGMQSPTNQADRTVSTPTPPSECPDDAAPPSYPSPPSNLTESAAENVALDSERAHVYRTLCGMAYDSFGIGGGVTTTEATVLNRTGGSITVRVRVPYTWTRRQMPDRTPPGTRTATPIATHADGSSRAVYRVTATSIERLREPDSG